MSREKTVFKKLEEGIESVKAEITELCKQDTVDTELMSTLKLKQKALLEIKDYVNSLEWLTKKPAKERMKVFLAAKGDYKAASEELHDSLGSMYVFVTNATKRLKQKIGENTIELILNGDVKIGLVQFYTLTGKYAKEAILMGEVLDKLPQGRLEFYDLTDCKNELRFFYEYSKAIMDKRYAALDEQKLALVMYVLFGDSPKYAKEKYHLMGTLNGMLKNNFEDYYKGVVERSTNKPIN